MFKIWGFLELKNIQTFFRHLSCYFIFWENLVWKKRLYWLKRIRDNGLRDSLKKNKSFIFILPFYSFQTDLLLKPKFTSYQNKRCRKPGAVFCSAAFIRLIFFIQFLMEKCKIFNKNHNESTELDYFERNCSNFPHICQHFRYLTKSIIVEVLYILIFLK